MTGIGRNMVAGVTALALAVILLAGCGTSPNTASTVPTNTVTPGPTYYSTAIPAQTPAPFGDNASYCQSQEQAWQSGGGTRDLKELSSAESAIAPRSSRLESDVKAGNSITNDMVLTSVYLGWLKGSIQTLQDNLPPACIPSRTRIPTRAPPLADYTASANFMESALTAIQQGDTVTAAIDSDLPNSSEATGIRSYIPLARP